MKTIASNNEYLYVWYAKPLGCILISDLVANLFMRSIPDMILLNFASPYHTKGVFAWDSLYSSKSIYENLLKEELKMQESQLNIGGAHKGDCKKAGETFTTGLRKMMLLFYKWACGRESIIDSTTC